MKKIWGFLFLLSLGGVANAETSSQEENFPTKGRSARLHEETLRLVSSSALESTLPEGDVTQRNEAEGSPGADLRRLDPRYAEAQVTYPEEQLSWWEALFQKIAAWF